MNVDERPPPPPRAALPSESDLDVCGRSLLGALVALYVLALVGIPAMIVVAFGWLTLAKIVGGIVAFVLFIWVLSEVGSWGGAP